MMRRASQRQVNRRCSDATAVSCARKVALNASGMKLTLVPQSLGGTSVRLSRQVSCVLSEIAMFSGFTVVFHSQWSGSDEVN